MKVAVIGTGISGNVAAYHLSQSHEVTVFEANDYIGGHTHTHEIDWAGQQYAVDTGFIVYNERTYPHFIELLEKLGVDSRPTTMSFSIKSELSGLEYNGHSLNTLFAQRSNLLRPSFHRMLRDILRFNREAPKVLDSDSADVGLGEYLRQHGYGKMFIENYIVPMGAAIWSTDPRRMQDFPARFFIRFFVNHGLLNIANRPRWFTIQGGSKQYVQPLINGFADRVRLSSPVLRVRRQPQWVEITTREAGVERFDAVFIAAHSDQALAMLDDPSSQEQRVLGAIAYQPNEAVLHTDQTILPKRRLAWAAWNYHVLANQPDQVALTYNMNILQGIDAPVQFCVTLNNSSEIDPDKVIKRMTYHHPVYTSASVEAQQQQAQINGANRTYYCGAYWRNGFHEDGVVSALNALQHFQQAQENEQLSIRRAS